MAVVAVGVVMLGCSVGTNTPARPAGLPSDAFGIGGADGGVFVRLTPSDAAAAAYSGAIYHPDGSVWYEGQFRLEPIGSGSKGDDQRRHTSGRDPWRTCTGGGSTARSRPPKRTGTP